MELKNIEKLENGLVKLTIAITKPEFEKAQDAAFAKNVGKISVPGFRKGKAPRGIIEKMYGKNVFLEDTINESYPEAYESAVEESKIFPIDRPHIDIVSVEDDGYVFTAIAPVKPEVEIGDYKGIHAEKDEPSVTEEQIDTELQALANRNARQQSVDRPIKDGDMAVISFLGTIDGVPFEGGASESHNLIIGSGQFIPGFEDQLIGSSIGDKLDVKVNFPEDYHSDDLKGKPAVFSCEILEVKEVIKPDLDDEFAKDVSEFDTLADFKNDIKSKMLEKASSDADIAYEEKLLDEIIGTLKADIPQILYDRQLDKIVQEFGYRVSAQGISLEQYINMNGMDMISFRKLFAEQAERQVKVRLVLAKIAELENIEITEEDMDKEITNMAKTYSLTEEQVRESLPKEALISDLKINRALDIIKQNALIKRKVSVRKVD